MKIVYNKSLKKFIKSLEKRTISKTLRMIDLLDHYESNLRMPYSKKVKDNIFELRINSKQEVRIFYTFYKNKIFLLNGFIKESNKTPKKEIKKAMRRFNRLD